jgi:SSS family solute:Na+ symporter
MNTLYFLFIFLGCLLFIQFGGKTFANANDVMIQFIGGLPVGLIGLLLASLFAAAMSSIDSLLNSMSTVFTKDIYERYIHPGEEASLKTSMLVSALWGLLIYVITMLAFAGTSKSILAVIGSYISYISGPSCGIFLLAMLTRRATDKGTFVGGILGFALTLFFGKTAGFSWMWNSAFGAAVTVILGLLLSGIFRDALPENALRYTISGQRALLRRENRSTEDGVSIMPLQVDRYSIGLLIFFAVQVTVLLILNFR